MGNSTRKRKQVNTTTTAGVGAVIKSLRIEKRLCQTTLAAMAKVSQQEISRIENGPDVGATFEVVRKLAKALGVDLDYISRRIPQPDIGDLEAKNKSEYWESQIGK